MYVTRIQIGIIRRQILSTKFSPFGKQPVMTLCGKIPWRLGSLTVRTRGSLHPGWRWVVRMVARETCQQLVWRMGGTGSKRKKPATGSWLHEGTGSSHRQWTDRIGTNRSTYVTLPCGALQTRGCNCATEEREEIAYWQNNKEREKERPTKGGKPRIQPR